MSELVVDFFVAQFLCSIVSACPASLSEKRTKLKENILVGNEQQISIFSFSRVNRSWDRVLDDIR